MLQGYERRAGVGIRAWKRFSIDSVEIISGAQGMGARVEAKGGESENKRRMDVVVVRSVFSTLGLNEVTTASSQQEKYLQSFSLLVSSFLDASQNER